MTKYKLPEGFKLTKYEASHRLQIHDTVRDIYGISDSLKEALEKIDNYLNALKLVSKTKLPNNYEIATNGIDFKFVLLKNGIGVDYSDSLETLIQQATKTTELDLQIIALNNGEEIEI